MTREEADALKEDDVYYRATASQVLCMTMQRGRLESWRGRRFEDILDDRFLTYKEAEERMEIKKIQRELKR